MAESFDSAVLAHNPDAIVVLDPAAVVSYWNTAAEAIFGFTAAEAIGRPLAELIIAPDRRDAFRDLLRESETTGLCIDESVCRRNDGARLHVSGSAKAVRSAGGELECFIITKKDVTPLKVGREVRIVEAMYRDLLEHTPDASLIVDSSGRIVMANARTEQLFGYSRQELIGHPAELLLPERHPQDHPVGGAGYFERPRTRAMAPELELLGQRRDGEQFPVGISLSPVETVEGGMLICAVRDIADRQEARTKADRRFRDLLESAPDAMVIVDEAGAIVYANSRAATLFGWKNEELQGQAVEMLVPERFRGEHPAHRSGFYAKPDVRQIRTRLDLYGLRKDHSEFPVEISLSTIHTEDGILIASAIRDSSERRFTEQLLLEANRLKSEFLANMSHELRTPLNGILGFSELLVDQRVGALNEKQGEYIEAILECGRHLLHLINDVLDLSKVEAGKMEVYAEEFSPRTAITSVFSVIGPLARKKQIRLNAPTGEAVATVTLDVKKFKQILFNLLSNAIKFTDSRGQIFVGLEAEGTDRMRLTVRDTGIGIAPTDLGRLFEAFRQLDGGASRHYDGTGLGLTLTRKLVELQGGTISVESVKDVGSTFTVLMPLAVCNSPAVE